MSSLTLRQGVKPFFSFIISLTASICIGQITTIVGLFWAGLIHDVPGSSSTYSCGISVISGLSSSTSSTVSSTSTTSIIGWPVCGSMIC